MPAPAVTANFYKSLSSQTNTGGTSTMTFTVPAFFVRFAESGWRLLDALQPSAYGIYLLHYIFIIWLQYAVYNLSLHAGVKAALVFVGTLAVSWTLTIMLRKIPIVARLI